MVQNTKKVFSTPYFFWMVKGDRNFASLILLISSVKVNRNPWGILCNCKWNCPYIFFLKEYKLLHPVVSKHEREKQKRQKEKQKLLEQFDEIEVRAGKINDF